MGVATHIVFFSFFVIKISFFLEVDAIYLLGGKGELGDNVGLCRIAVEGVILGGNINEVKRLDTKEVVLDMKAVRLQGRSLYSVVLASVMALEYEALLRIVRELRKAERLVLVAARQGIDLYVVGEEILSSLYLTPYLLALPLKPIGNVRKFRLTLACQKLAVLAKLPTLSAFGTEDLNARRCHF